MRVTFILPSIGVSGGAKVVFQYADRLHARGHHVVVVYPLFPMRWGAPWSDVRAARDQVMLTLGNLRKGVRVRWFDLHAALRRTPTLAARHIPDADIVVASAWPTAPVVHRYPASKGKKFYLIQGYEAVMGPERLVDATWRLPLHKIVIATWLKKLGEEKFGQPIDALIINGVDLEHFYGTPRPPQPEKRVGMLWHPAEWKGVPDGLRAVEQARKTFPGLQLVLFGAHRTPGIPAGAEFHLDPPVQEIREIYTSCDVFLSPSWSEGCQLPPMEAMACGCAVTATNVGGIPDYAVAGETAMVVPPKRPDRLAGALIELLGDDRKRKEIALAGQRHIRQFTWDRATDRLERAFANALENAPSSSPSQEDA